MSENIERDSKIEGFYQHFTPRQVAEYMRSKGRLVGRRFSTHGAIWDAKDEQKLGLLHLILDAIEKRSDEALDKHREWLRLQHAHALQLCLEYQKQKTRILSTLCGEHVTTVMLKSQDFEDWKYSDIHRLAQYWCNNTEEYTRQVNELQGVVWRLRAVQKPEDLITLRGVGKKTVEKVIASMERMKSDSETS